MKKALTILLTAAVFLGLCSAFSAAEPTQKQVIENFKKGLYIGDWVPSTLSEATVREMAECGIQYTFLWAFDYSNPKKVQELEWCSKYGIKVFLKDNRIYGTVMKDMTAEEILSYIRPSIGNPNILGYCVFDEPGENSYEDLAAALKNYYAVSEGMIGTVNLYPHIYGSYIDRVFTMLGQDFVSVDIYPLQDVTESTYYYNLKQVGDSARAHGGDFWLFIQSMGWNSKRRPDLYDLRWQLWSGLAFGATKFMHFCYSNPAYYPTYDPNFKADGYCAVNDGVKSDLYPVLQQFNTEAQYLAQIVADYSDLGTFPVWSETDAEPPVYVFELESQPKCEEFRTIASISSDQCALVGAFAHNTDALRKGFVIVNASDVSEELEADVTFTLRYSDAPVLVTRDGYTESVSADENGVYHLHLGAGGGAFIEVSERERTESEKLFDQYYADCFAVKNAYINMDLNRSLYDTDTLNMLEQVVSLYEDALRGGEMTLEELAAARSDLQNALTGVKTILEMAAEILLRYEQTDSSVFDQSDFTRLTNLKARLDSSLAEQPINENAIRLVVTRMYDAFQALRFIGLPGDLTRDGRVTLADVIRAAKHVLDGEADYTQMRIGDINGSNMLELSDVIAIAHIVLEG